MNQLYRLNIPLNQLFMHARYKEDSSNYICPHDDLTFPTTHLTLESCIPVAEVWTIKGLKWLLPLPFLSTTVLKPGISYSELHCVCFTCPACSCHIHWLPPEFFIPPIQKYPARLRFHWPLLFSLSLPHSLLSSASFVREQADIQRLLNNWKYNLIWSFHIHFSCQRIGCVRVKMDIDLDWPGVGVALLSNIPLCGAATNPPHPHLLLNNN